MLMTANTSTPVVDHGTAVLVTTLAPCQLNVLAVIVCYKAPELTIECLESLVPQLDEISRAKVAICENGTGAKAIQRIKTAIENRGWEDVVMLKAIEPNQGFTGGNNAILRETMDWPQPPRYSLLLNADTIVKPGALKTLYDQMEHEPTWGIAGPSLIGPEGEAQESCFRDPSPMAEFLWAAKTGVLNRALGRGASPLTAARNATSYDWTSFAAAMVRREVFEQIGLLDEGYFLYFDDPDFCRRARQAGWTIGHIPHATVVHLEGESNAVPEKSRLRKRRPRYYYASRSRYFAKFYGRAGLWLANLAWLAGRAISKPREWLGRPTHICAAEWRDIWHGWSKPISRTEARISSGQQSSQA